MARLVDEERLTSLSLHTSPSFKNHAAFLPMPFWQKECPKPGLCPIKRHGPSAISVAFAEESEFKSVFRKPALPVQTLCIRSVMCWKGS